MAGNVWEWVADWYAYDYYASSPSTDPPGPGSGTTRVFRGGSWSHDDPLLRVADRSLNVPTYQVDYLGVRCARTP